MSATLISTDRLPASFQQDLLSGGTVLWFRCKDCGSTWVGDDSGRPVIKHARSCTTKAQVVPAPVAAPQPPAVNLVTAARDGEFRRFADEDELVYLVQNGLISASTAMNQDL
jgi:hypothetical protein